MRDTIRETRRLRWLALALIATTSFACTSSKTPTAATTSPPAAPTATPSGAPDRAPARDADAIPFEEATLIVETNATDGDAGLQPFLDHEPWKWVAIYMPDGRKILDVVNREELEDYGLTELFSESSEPPFDEFPFEEFKKLWPEGGYTFLGETLDGKTLHSEVRLTHDIPEGPKIVSPTRRQRFTGDVVIRWAAVTRPRGIDIVGYQVIVETTDDPLRVLEADLPASARELVVPEAFASPGKYKVEVMAIEKSGNQTLTEVPFSVR